MAQYTPPSPFDITRRDPAGNASASFPLDTIFSAVSGSLVAGATYAPRGFALGAAPTLNADGTDAFQPAQSTNFIGHLTRDVVNGGLSLADRVFGRTSPTPVGVVGPFATGDKVTVEKAEELEAEGSAYLLLSGTYAITPQTQVGTKLTFNQGLLCLLNSGEPDHAFYTLTGNNLPPSDGVSLRIRAERI